MDDLQSKIEQGRNWFERAAAHLPGYRGYKQKEVRREADKMQREYVAERLEKARRALEKLQLDLTRGADLSLLGLVDVTQRKLRTVKDRYLFADYGYAGWFDAVKVKEDTLDQLYQFDVQSQEQAQGVEDLVATLDAQSPSLKADIALLDQKVETLDEFFAQREHLITGVGRQ